MSNSRNPARQVISTVLVGSALCATPAAGQRVVAISGSGTSFSPIRSVETDGPRALALSTCGDHCCAILDDGTLVVFGNFSATQSVPWSAQLDLYAGAGSLRDVAQAALGEGHVVVLDTQGAVQCAGHNGLGQCDVPTPLPGCVQVAAGEATSAAIHADGSISVWGYIPGGFAHGPADLLAVRAIDCGAAFVTVALADGHMRAWGSGGNPAFPGDSLPDPPSWPTDIIQVAAGNKFILGLRSGGEVVSWNWGPLSGATTFPIPLTDCASIDANGSLAVAVLKSGWVIPNLNGGALQPPPPPMAPVLQSVQVGFSFIVGLTDEGRIESPRQPSSTSPSCGAGAAPAGSQTPVEAGLTSRGTFIRNADGSVATWARCFDSDCTISGLDQPVLSIAAASTHELALLQDGTVKCFGENEHGQCDVPIGLDSCVGVFADTGLSGAVLADGGIRLWGRNDAGQLDVPSLPGPVKIVRTFGGEVVCAVLEEGTISCWGAFASEVCAATQSVDDAIDILLGEESCYILRASGGVWRCGYGQAPQEVAVQGVEQLGRFSAIADLDPIGRLADGSLVNLRTEATLAVPWRVISLEQYGRIAIIADDACADLDGDGFVGGAELAAVLGAWGTDGTGTGGGSSGQGADFDGSGVVDGADLLIVLSQYGECGL